MDTNIYNDDILRYFLINNYHEKIPEYQIKWLELLSNSKFRENLEKCYYMIPRQCGYTNAMNNFLRISKCMSIIKLTRYSFSSTEFKHIKYYICNKTLYKVILKYISERIDLPKWDL